MDLRKKRQFCSRSVAWKASGSGLVALTCTIKVTLWPASSLSESFVQPLVVLPLVCCEETSTLVEQRAGVKATIERYCGMISATLSCSHCS